MLGNIARAQGWGIRGSPDQQTMRTSLAEMNQSDVPVQVSTNLRVARAFGFNQFKGSDDDRITILAPNGVFASEMRKAELDYELARVSEARAMTRDSEFDSKDIQLFGDIVKTLEGMPDTAHQPSGHQQLQNKPETLSLMSNQMDIEGLMDDKISNLIFKD